MLLRRRGRINEARKFGWKTYCSQSCISKDRNKQGVTKCYRCGKQFRRSRKELTKSELSFCSLNCAATVNNSRFPKRKAVIKSCLFCGKKFKGDPEKYCSTKCQYKAQVISSGSLLKQIKKFYQQNRRIPLKREFPHYHAIRGRFGTWNNAIKAAGFSPNPVMFAKKYIANDDHKCDSLAEKIIDDWLYARKIKHERNVPYPSGNGFTADFVVDDYWIEFFGLHGEHKRYDELRKEKLGLIKKYKLKLVEIYPKHLFPENLLDETLAVLRKYAIV